MPVARLLGKAEPPAGERKSLPDELRHGPGGVHARPEGGVVVALASHATDDRHDVRRPLGEMLSQPLTEQIFHFPWQT